MQKIAVIYCRVSTEDQKDNGTSLESQEQYCLDYAAQNNWRVHRVVKEDASGMWLDRPKFASVREDIRTGRANILLCHVADRMSRHQTHSLMFFDSVCEANAELWLVLHGKIEDSPMGRAMLSLYATGAAMEHANIIRRTLDGKRTRIVKDKKLHSYGLPLYGYRLEEMRDEKDVPYKTGKRIINAVEATVVRSIFEMRAKGEGLHSITNHLINLAIPCPSAGKRKSPSGNEPKWSTGTVHRILKEPAYKGVTIGWRYTTKKVRNSKGEMYKRVHDRNDSVILPEGTTPAIVSDELWDKAQSANVTAHTGRFIKSNNKLPALFRGHIFCGVCNKPMYAFLEHTCHERLRYRCCSQISTGQVNCGNGRAKENATTEFAWPLIASILKDPDVITRAIKNLKDDEPNQQLEFDLQSARAGLDRCEKNIQRLIKRMADDDDAKDFEPQYAERKKEREQYRAMIAEIESQMGANLKQVVDLTDLQNYCDEVRDVVDDFGFEEKRLAIEALRVKIYYYKDGQMRLDVPVAVKKAIGYEVPMELIAQSTVEAFQMSSASPQAGR